MSLNALMRLVPGPCGPRQRSVNGPLRVERDGLQRVRGIGILHQVLDQLDLVVLALAAEALDGVGHRQVLAHEVLVGLDVLAHLGLDRLEVLLGELHAVRELEVVVEAVLDRRPDRDLHAGVELHHRGGEHVRGVVADQPEAVLVAAGHDLDARAVLERRLEVPELAVDADSERRPGQALADRAGGVGAGRALVELELSAVREQGLHAACTVAASTRSSRSSAEVTRKCSRTRSRPARPISIASPGSRTSSTILAAASLGIGREEAVHAVPHGQRDPAHHRRALPERLERGELEALAERALDHRAREQQQRADLEAAEALVGGEQQHVVGALGVVGDLLRGLPALGGRAVEQRREHELEVRLLGLGHAEGVDGRVRVVPAVELQHLEAERPLEVHAERAHHPARQARLELEVARIERVDAGRRHVEPLVLKRGRRERLVRHEHRGAALGKARRARERVGLRARGVLVEAPQHRRAAAPRRDAEARGQPERGVVQHDRVVAVLQRARPSARRRRGTPPRRRPRWPTRRRAAPTCSAAEVARSSAEPNSTRHSISTPAPAASGSSPPRNSGTLPSAPAALTCRMRAPRSGSAAS